MDTNVPAPVWTSNGFLIPTDAEIYSGTFADINQAFGGNLNPALSTPQSQIATSMAAAISNADQIFLFYTNQTNPDFAEGRMQDAIGQIYFLTRLPARPTVIQVECFGLVGVVINVGAQVKDVSGNIYTCTDEATISPSGSVITSFANNNAGPIAVPDEDGISIYLAIPGWDSATCNSGVVGANTESRSQFEERRKQSVAVNSVNSLDAVLGAVLSVSGVLDAYVTENDTNAPTIKGGVFLEANSLYVAVVGGTAADVAYAIWSKKSPGCVYNGDVVVQVPDPAPTYTPPVPTYSVKFKRPSALPILFSVVITNGPNVPADAATQIKNKIVSAFNGEDGGSRRSIGSTVYASRYVTPVALIGSWVQLQSLQVGSFDDPEASFIAAIASSLMTVTSVGAGGVLRAGQTLIGVVNDIVVNTKILSQASGTPGGIGTYNLSNSQTSVSQAMKASSASYPTVDTNIDQSPTLDANNISVALA